MLILKIHLLLKYTHWNMIICKNLNKANSAVKGMATCTAYQPDAGPLRDYCADIVCWTLRHIPTPDKPLCRRSRDALCDCAGCTLSWMSFRSPAHDTDSMSFTAV